MNPPGRSPALRFVLCSARTAGRASLLVFAAACGSEQTDACVEAPTFTRDIQPLNEQKCLPCHRLGGDPRVPPNLYFETWPEVSANVLEFADAITSGRQPPEGFQPAVLPEERALVRAWRICGFRE